MQHVYTRNTYKQEHTFEIIEEKLIPSRAKDRVSFNILYGERRREKSKLYFSNVLDPKYLSQAGNFFPPVLVNVSVNKAQFIHVEVASRKGTIFPQARPCITRSALFRF